MKDSLGRSGSDFRPGKVDLTSGSAKNNCRSVHSLSGSTSCLDCPTPSSMPIDDKNRCIGVSQMIFDIPSVITQSTATETLLNTPDILVRGLVGMAGSSPSVPCKIKSLKSVIQSMMDSSIKTCLMNDDKFTVPTSLEASCSMPAKFVAYGITRTGDLVASPKVPLRGQEVTGIQAGKCNDNSKSDTETGLECLPCLENSMFQALDDGSYIDLLIQSDQRLDDNHSSLAPSRKFQRGLLVEDSLKHYPLMCSLSVLLEDEVLLTCLK